MTFVRRVVALAAVALVTLSSHAAGAQMTPAPMSESIDQVCGAGTAAGLREAIAAIQPRTTRLGAGRVTDIAQAEIHTVSPCLGTMPDTTPVPVFDALLSSILQLASYASYSLLSHPNPPREREFVLVAAQVETRLCVSPDLMQQTAQYHTTRNILANYSLNRARRLLATPNSDLEPFRAKYRACARRLGADPIG
jgi:hypothetical protein